MQIPFDRNKHVFHSPEFEEIIKDTLRFFNGTPVHPLELPESFNGTGVYALYYTGAFSAYKKLFEINRIAYNQPIYVGKAVPQGWRQARNRNFTTGGSELYRRLMDHLKSVTLAENLDPADFHCRFMILEGAESDLISTVESALIREFKPVWNSCIDGFGNHDPGKGRYNQMMSEWDTLHPGREWAQKCQPSEKTPEQLEQEAIDYLNV